MKSTDRISLRDDAAWRATSDEECVILNLSNGEYYSLNLVAKEIWEFIGKSENPSLAEIAAEICGKFDVESHVAHQDMVEILKQLKDEKLIVVNK